LVELDRRALVYPAPAAGLVTLPALPLEKRMKTWLRHAVVPALILVTPVLALAQSGSAKGESASGSIEQQVAARFAERSGGTKPDQVFRGRGGLYEVLVGGELYYVDANVNFVIAGRMFDARTREDLTQKRLDTALKVDLKSLPLERAVKTQRGDGSRVMVTFEDPNCPYCKKLWQNLQDLKNVTIYTFLYPILSPDSHEKSKGIWCAKDRAGAWDEYMVGGKAPPAAPETCQTPLEENVALGRKLGISGTPTIIFADGTRSAGAMPVPMIEQRLAAKKN
jgi:thiol:disulfide interchange protein DsbC